MNYLLLPRIYSYFCLFESTWPSAAETYRKLRVGSDCSGQEISETGNSYCKQYGVFDFLCLPIVNPRYKRELLEGPATSRPGALTRSDLLLSSQDWSTLVVGKVSPWLHLDSKVHHLRRNSEKAFKQEIAYAAHLGLPAVLVPLKTRRFANLARVLNEHLMSSYVHQQFWLQIPLLSAKDQCENLLEDGPDNNNDARYEDTWEWWHKFHTMCDFYKKMGVALELTADLPAEEVLERWLAELIKCVVIPTNLFLTNKKGYPVLSRAHQSYLRRLFKLDIQIILTGIDRHPHIGIGAYQQYLDHLFQTQPPPDTVSQFARGYEDYLQCPLQPLMDNLESQTYEIFEKDPVKYSQYQKAIYHALLDRIPTEQKDTKEIVLTVVGAGRGPLVRAAVAAAQQADRKIRVFAVEKNPNAVITLENLKDEVWGEQVTVVSCDMRDWEAPEKTDILVSELLGSFGDNELSPECLDGAQRFLKDDGISIPRDYTSYLAPLQSTKLYNEVRMCREKDKHQDSMFEMPYVVRLHNCQILSEPKKVFSFHHPNRDSVMDNNRYASLEFRMENNGVLHGFSGYFETTLYKDIKLSILPSTHSPGMFSWFPILFPIKTPVYLKKGSRVVFDIWRLCTAKNIWYEWCLLEPQILSIHNPKGRSYTIGL